MTKTMTRAAIATFAGLTCLLIGACHKAGESANGGSTVEIGVSPAGGTAASVYLAIEDGIFARHGITVKPVVVNSPAAAVPQVMSGDLQVAMTDFLAAAKANEKGLPLVVVGTASVVPSHDSQFTAFVTSSSSPLTSMAGVHTLASPTIRIPAVISLASERLNGAPRTMRAVEVPVQAIASTVAAGRVDAGYLWQPFLDQALKAGGVRVLAYIGPKLSLPGAPAVVFAARRDWLDSHPKIARELAAALVEATRNAAAHPDRASAAVVKAGLVKKPIPTEYLPEYPTSQVTREQYDAMAALNRRYGLIGNSVSAATLLWPTR